MINFKNRPPHLFADHGCYFITTKTLKGRKFLNTDLKKRIWMRVFNDMLREFDYKCYAWVLLDNHSHFLLGIDDADRVSRFFVRLHAISSKKINDMDDTRGRKTWFNYWDKYVRDEENFWKFLNYIHVNPLKHGYVPGISELSAYKYSSSQNYIGRFGWNWFMELFYEYPIETVIDRFFE